MGRHIEALLARNARIAGGHDVAHGIAAASPGGEADPVQLPHDLRHVGKPDVVQLQFLAGGDMDGGFAEPARELRDLGQLNRRHAACRHADTDHEGPFVPLFVDTEGDPDRPELGGMQPVIGEGLDSLGKGVDFVAVITRNFVKSHTIFNSSGTTCPFFIQKTRTSSPPPDRETIT